MRTLFWALGLWTVVVFWNVENFFDPFPSSTNESELSFTPTGSKAWNKTRFDAKAMGIAKTVLSMTDSLGAAPDIVAVAEVENEYCVRYLARRTPLRRLGYNYLHFDSPDPRGIDCALLYRPSTLGRAHGKARPVLSKNGDVLPTRHFLIAEFDSLSVAVVHLPSKLGNGKGSRRTLALSQLGDVCDSLKTRRGVRVLALGDFNDSRTAESDSLMRGMSELSERDSKGSYRYNGDWDLIDRAFVSYGEAAASLRVWDAPYLTEKDTKYGGFKPRRTFNGPKYLAGISDHYPIIVSF